MLAAFSSRSFLTSEMRFRRTVMSCELCVIFSSIGTRLLSRSWTLFSLPLIAFSILLTSRLTVACSLRAASSFFSKASTLRRNSFKFSWCSWIWALDSSMTRWKWYSFHRMWVMTASSRSSVFFWKFSASFFCSWYCLISELMPRLLWSWKVWFSVACSASAWSFSYSALYSRLPEICSIRRVRSCGV